MSRKPAVLVTGSRAPVAVLMARTLTSAGFDVYTADSLRPNLGQYSRAPLADLEFPPPRTQPDAFREAVQTILSAANISMVVPTCEEIYHLAYHRTPGLFAPPLNVLDALHNKYSISQVAVRAGVAMPETILLCNSADRDRLIPYDRDGVLKRVYSRFSQHVVLLKGIPDERRRAVARVDFSDGAPWVWQEYVGGRSVCTYSLCNHGQVAYHVAYTTPYTMGGGAGVYYASADPHPSKEIAARLTTATGFTGQLSLDFMEDDSGKLWLIECNPRATMGLALCYRRPDFAAILRDILLGAWQGQTGLVPEGTAVQMRLATLLFGGIKPPYGQYRWFRDVLQTPDALADPADPGPSRAQPGILLQYALRAFLSRKSLAAYTTHDIEWNGQEGKSWLPQ